MDGECCHAAVTGAAAAIREGHGRHQHQSKAEHVEKNHRNNSSRRLASASLKGEGGGTLMRLATQKTDDEGERRCEIEQPCERRERWLEQHENAVALHHELHDALAAVAGHHM